MLLAHLLWKPSKPPFGTPQCVGVPAFCNLSTQHCLIRQLHTRWLRFQEARRSRLPRPDRGYWKACLEISSLLRQTNSTAAKNCQFCFIRRPGAHPAVGTYQELAAKRCDSRLVYLVELGGRECRGRDVVFLREGLCRHLGFRKRILVAGVVSKADGHGSSSLNGSSVRVNR